MPRKPAPGHPCDYYVGIGTDAAGKPIAYRCDHHATVSLRLIGNYPFDVWLCAAHGERALREESRTQ